MFPNCPGPIQSQHNMSCGSNATSRPWFRVCLRSSSVTYVSHIHAYIHTYIHTCMHACMHASIHPSVHPHIHIHACMHTCIHTYIHTYIHTCTHTRTNTIYQYKHTHTHTRTCVYIYIYTHICSHPPRPNDRPLWGRGRVVSVPMHDLPTDGRQSPLPNSIPKFPNFQHSPQPFFPKFPKCLSFPPER